MKKIESITDNNGKLRLWGFFNSSDFSYNKFDTKHFFDTKEYDRYIFYNREFACEIYILSSSRHRGVYIRFFDHKASELYEYKTRDNISVDEFSLPIFSQKEKTVFANRKVSLKTERTPAACIIKCAISGFKANDDFFLNIWLNEENKTDSVLVIPFKRNPFSFILLQDINPIFTNGVIRMGKLEINLENENSFAFCEKLRASFRYSNIKGRVLYQAFFSELIDNIPLGMNVMWVKDYSGEQNNAATFGNVAYKQSDIHIKSNKNDMHTWVVYSNDGKLDLRFKPFSKYKTVTTIGNNDFDEIKYFGYFSGKIIAGDNLLTIEDVLGIISEKRF